jgi:hemerythrin
MAFMIWTKELSVSVAVLDEDHKKMIDIINELHDGIIAGHKQEILASVLDQLADYTRFHFAREEEFFVQANYPDVSTHKMEHTSFIGRISNLQERFKTASIVMLDLELMNFLRNWLLIHIQGSDMKYGPRFNASGIF